MVIAAGARASGGGGGGGGGGREGSAEEDGAAAHVVVEVHRSAGVAAAADDDDRLQEQEMGCGTGGSGCRICHLEDGDLPEESGGGKLVNLGCGCRGEIAAAHRRCAEAWFSVKGNRRCEICGQNAANISGRGGGGKEFMQQWHGTAAAAEGSSKATGFCRSQTFCNLLIACLIIVFVLPWFFHNHMI